MFERFTERARQVLVLARDEASGMKHSFIGTEHLLLGLLREQEGLAARVLESLNITVDDVRGQVARIVGQGDEVTTGQIPFTPRAKKVCELSLREALSLGHNYIGTEHILLGLVRENEGVAARILLDYDVDANKIRDEITKRLVGPSRERFDVKINVSPKMAVTGEAVAEAIRKCIGLKEEKSELNDATVAVVEEAIVEANRRRYRLEREIRIKEENLADVRAAHEGVTDHLAALEETLGEEYSVAMSQRVGERP